MSAWRKSRKRLLTANTSANGKCMVNIACEVLAFVCASCRHQQVCSPVPSLACGRWPTTYMNHIMNTREYESSSATCAPQYDYMSTQHQVHRAGLAGANRRSSKTDETSYGFQIRGQAQAGLTSYMRWLYTPQWAIGGAYSQEPLP
eukprot:6196946-Pleurochrysis_carterae.AAC.1